VLIAPEAGTVQGRNHLDEADVFEATVALGDAEVGEYDALVLPGGVANPDDLRTRPEAVRLIGAFADAGKPIAAICHAPWTLIDAGVAKGRRLTSWPSIRTDLTNAGAQWVDEEVVVSEDGPSTLVTSRRPDDLDAFCREVVRVISEQP
jgi:protease I